MVRSDQSAALQTMRQATGIMAGGTISAILGFSMDATTAAVSARAGLGRPSGRCGIVGRSQQKVWPTDGHHIAPEPAANSVVNAFPFRVIATEVTPKKKRKETNASIAQIFHTK